MEYTQTETKVNRLEYDVNNLINSLRSIRGDLEDIKRDLEKLRDEKSRKAVEVHNHYHYPHGWYWHYPSAPGTYYPVSKMPDTSSLKITYGNTSSSTADWNAVSRIFTNEKKGS